MSAHSSFRLHARVGTASVQALRTAGHEFPAIQKAPLHFSIESCTAALTLNLRGGGRGLLTRALVRLPVQLHEQLQQRQALHAPLRRAPLPGGRQQVQRFRGVPLHPRHLIKLAPLQAAAAPVGQWALLISATCMAISASTAAQELSLCIIASQYSSPSAVAMHDLPAPARMQGCWLRAPPLPEGARGYQAI